MMTRIGRILLVCIGTCALATATYAESKPAIAIIGTGDMGDSLGPRFVELGYQVIYGSRKPDGEKAQGVLAATGGNSSVTTQREAAQAGDIVILAGAMAGNGNRRAKPWLAGWKDRHRYFVPT